MRFLSLINKIYSFDKNKIFILLNIHLDLNIIIRIKINYLFYSKLIKN